MARMISRNEAAELLDCNPQTISNWIKRGIIKAHEVDGHLLIDRQSIERFLDDLKDLADMENKLAEAKNEVKVEIKELKAIFDEVRGNSLPSQRARDCFRENQLTLINILEDCLNSRERVILTRLIQGESAENIGRTFGLSSERIVQISLRATRKLSSIEDLKHKNEEFKDLKKENDFLKLQCNNLRKRLNQYEKKDDEKEANLYSSIFQKRLTELNLTVRTLNVLKMNNCDTLGDVVRLEKADVIKARNFGKKSFTELDEFIRKLGLHWGMNPDNMSAEELEKCSSDNFNL